VKLLPRSLFGRAALLIALTLLVFSAVVWQAVMWAIVVPSAEQTADVIAQRATEALNAHRLGKALPESALLATGEPSDALEHLGRTAFGVYMRRLRAELQRQLQTNDVVIAQARAPTLIWIRIQPSDNNWLVLTSRLASPAAPLAFTLVLLISTLLVLGVAAWSARRLTTPLARLARDAAGVVDGQTIGTVDESAPSEVRALAFALQSMSQRLYDLNEQREIMLAGISHDLRSPLARMRVALELLDERDAELAQSMALEIEEMDHMVGQFLHYVRAGYSETSVRALPDEVIEDALKGYTQEPRLQLRLEARDACELNVEGLRHIVLNLVQNALDHGQPPVTLSTRLQGRDLELLVHDTGSGISAEEWPQALRAFGRLQAVPNAGHSGLGLALVDRLVRAVRATISARQLPDGFEIRLVFARVRLQAPAAAS
jgi:two-component system, OmpR family, osmolarity sensor histidine kinase EnvZ